MKNHMRWTRVILLAAIVCCATGCDMDETGLTEPSIDPNLIRPDGMGPHPTIQAAIFAAADGDTIELANGIFTGDGNRDIDFLGKAITVLSRSGKPALCVIDCQADADSSHRAFIFQQNEGPDSVLEGIGITNGNVLAPTSELRGGGGILCLNASSPTFRNLIFFGNEAGAGGALACFGESSPTVSDCTFERNVSQNGGAIVGSGFNITDSQFLENSSLANFGGAIAGSDFTVNRCLFVRNSASAQGGAIAAWGSSEINDCIMSENKAGNYGGAIYFGGDNTMTGCSLVGNEAGLQGSGVYCDYESEITITRSIIAFGKTREGIFAQSSAAVDIRCSDIFGNAEGDWTGILTDQLGSNGNIAADPLFCTSNPGLPGFCALQDDSPCTVSDCGMMGAVGAGRCAQ